MQGRLLAPFEGRFQAFPAKKWSEEFYKAQQVGVHSIEWIYEEPYSSENPLTIDSGICEIQELMAKTGVQVKSVCADYYMTRLLIENANIIKENWQHLEWLIQQGKKLDITYIILPFVDSSSLKTEDDQQALIQKLKVFLKRIENVGIEIHLEADLSPDKLLNIFEKVDHPLLKMNYDTGNSASLGYDPDEEFNSLGKYLGSIHIKDRILGGGTVPLGSGSTQFQKCFKWFKKLKFNRWYVLQAARGSIGDEVATISNQMNFIEKEG